VVRCEARAVTSGAVIEIELPHLHHDVPALKTGARVPLRLSNFSVFARGKPISRQALPDVVANAPAEYRERARAG